MKNEDYIPTNREKVRQPKLGKHYCGGCDGVLLGDDGGKFATFYINEVYQKLERTIDKYKNINYWKFEARIKQ